MKKIKTALIVFLLIFILPFNNIKAEDNVVHISTIEDWNEFTRNCEFDIYSKGKTIVLDNDLVFNNNFVPVPYFNGTFDGNSHCLKNINVTSYLTNDGIFRITGKDSIIKNLLIEMSVFQDAKRYGMVGYNQGLIENISAKVCINGDDEIGAIAGYNAVSGKINNCRSSGTINGKHLVGGIAGINYGLVLGSINKANVNNEVEKEDLDISTLTIESLTDPNIASKLNDIGGIVGINYGVVEKCYNYGTIGHEHVGYNVGGIVGGQSGYVNSCFNHGLVQGRKEVGGIVGQAEPSMSLIFSEDYIQNMKRQIKSINEESSSIIDELRVSKDTNASFFEDVVDNLNEAYDAIEQMIEHRGDESEYDTGKVALSSALRNALDTSKNLVEYNKESSSIYYRVKDVSQNIMDLGTTSVNFADSITQEKEVYVDVSYKDTKADKEGKIANCVNYSDVEGDINVGGITGSMAIENNLNPEDDFKIVGTTSFDARYEIRDVIDSCTNYGKISIKRNYAGGICGNQTAGLIKNSINFGLLNCIDGNYVGGIVGKAIGNLDNNQSKCFIFAKDYVGGIAGSSEKGTNNGSMSQILSYKSNAGSIFGNYGRINEEIVEKANDISNNWYVYDDLAGIDGISYDSKAYQISNEEMLDKVLNDELKVIKIIFMHDDDIVLEKTVKYGTSISKDTFPYDYDENNDYCSWNSYDGRGINNLTKDILFISNYTDVLPSISSEEKPLAYVVLNGKFEDKDNVQVFRLEKDNEIDYTIRTSINNNSHIESYCIYTNEYDKYKVFVSNNNILKEIEYKEDGRYAIIYPSGDLINQVRIVKINDYSSIIIGIVIVITVIISLFVIVKRKKKKENNCS